MEIKVKKYIPHIEKAGIVKAITDICCKEQDGLIIYDNMERELYFNVLLAESYADYKFELDEDGKYIEIDKQYDKLAEDGTMSTIIDNIGKDYFILLESLEVEIEQRLKQNTIEAIIGRLGTSLLTKLDEFIKTMTPESVGALAEAIKGIDPKVAKTILSISKDIK
jgi:hypothetical protein